MRKIGLLAAMAAAFEFSGQPAQRRHKERGKLPSFRLNQQNASKSKRVMRKQWGAQPEKVGRRRFKRAEQALRYRWS